MIPPIVTHLKYSQPYKDSVEMQRLLIADARARDCEPRLRCLIARAYKELEELKLRLRMKPAPKPIDTTLVAKRSNKGMLSQSETTEA